ncbi:flagellar biosynthetic protein FliQ [Candidatus Arthromitus sp. SFB-rat-Yit]|uniref:flagellar biosynthetic protein FliQ n=1 Tax=Candidatus Arthromitus sp. SFB-rat-Yit TaxID=1041504 RepID=UPI000227A40B|nr:flagellar biosynthetic protein FliQ [Candidatus Arthromitus sp. SFB-rat-Yit]BAK81515.1 flagellar biosynthetic protein FliQ [Candidatus Arthromitus sp. SFB-rat-Yit]
MSQNLAISVIRKALVTGFKISIPFLLITMIIGIAISIIQAITHLNDQSLTFVPKVLILSLMGLMMAPFVIKQMVKFTNEMFNIVQKITTG